MDFLFQPHDRAGVSYQIGQKPMTDDYKQCCKDRQQLIAICDEKGTEIQALRTALKRCREAARNNFSVTTRDFASMCGVSATQISEWTSEPITTEPDFRD